MSLIYTERAEVTGGKRHSVYVGGRTDARDADKLERWGISHILNVTPTKEASIQAGVPNFFEKTKRFKYKRIQVYDAPTSAQQLFDSASSIVNFISSGLFHGSVLIHCQHGMSRSTTCCLFYLMSKAGLKLEDAFTLVKRRRPQAKPIPAFMEILKKYEKELLGDSSLSENGEKSNNRKRKIVGPAIGPSVMNKKPASNSSCDGKTTASAAIIGPAMPPKKDSEPSSKAANASETVVIGPSMPRVVVEKEKSNESSIGPQLPG